MKTMQELSKPAQSFDYRTRFALILSINRTNCADRFQPLTNSISGLPRRHTFVSTNTGGAFNAFLPKHYSQKATYKMANPLEQVANSGLQMAVVTNASAPTMDAALAAKSLPNILALQRNNGNGTQQVSIIDGPMTSARSNDTIAMTGTMSLFAGAPPESYVTITLRNTGTTDGVITLFDVDDLHKHACNGCTSVAGNVNISAFMGSASCDSLQSFYKQLSKYRYPVLSLVIEDETANTTNPRLGFSINGSIRNGAGYVLSDVLDTRRQRDLKQIAQDVVYVAPPSNSLFSVLDSTCKWDVPVRAGQTISITFNFGPRAQAN